jgi:hypothetical protein
MPIVMPGEAEWDLGFQPEYEVARNLAPTMVAV